MEHLYDFQTQLPAQSSQEKFQIALNPLIRERLVSYLSPHYYPWINCKGHENKRNGHRSTKYLIVKQIFLVITKVTVEWTSVDNMNIIVRFYGVTTPLAEPLEIVTTLTWKKKKKHKQ